MDEKVLKLLINRVVESSHYARIHMDSEWEDFLEKDKQRLVNYVLKYTVDEYTEVEDKTKEELNKVYGIVWDLI